MGNFVKYATLASVALLAACSGNQLTNVAPSSSGATDAATQVRTLATAGVAKPRAHGGWILPDKKHKKGVVYVSDIDTNAVEIYPAKGANPAPIGEITDGINTPDGLGVDAKGNLYVPNAGASNVTVYKPGTTSPFMSYSPGPNPVFVVIGKDGTVYIAQGIVGCICVTVYGPQSTTPEYTIQLDNTGGSPIGMTLDKKNNLYIALTNATVYEFAPGQTTGTNLGLSGLHNPRGLAFDNKGDLLVADDPLSFTTGFVDIYPPGKTSFSKQITVGPQPFEIAFGRHDALLYVANVSYGNTGDVEILSAHKGYTQVNELMQSLEQPIGVALSPGAP
jgi:DNA-binding beta-propeller fold protein YncE